VDCLLFSAVSLRGTGGVFLVRGLTRVEDGIRRFLLVLEVSAGVVRASGSA
jgi:hypothetical protein